MLVEAVDSILQQDYPYKKIVIIDDGSTDNTKEVGNALSNQYPDVVVYKYKQNAGCSSARNMGLQYINEQIGYVCFLDSDDKFLSGKFSREVKLLQENPRASFTYSDYVLFKESRSKEEFVKVASSGNPGNFSIEHFLTNNAKSSSFLFLSSTLMSRRFREDLLYNEDSEFHQRIAIEYEGVYCSQPGCWIRDHDGSKSRNRVEIYKAVQKAAYGIIEQYPKFFHEHRKLIENRLVEIKTYLFRELLLAQKWDEASAYASTEWQRLILKMRFNYLYRMKVWLGKISDSFYKEFFIH